MLDICCIILTSSQVGQYHKQVYNLQQRQNLGDSYYPRIVTVDSAQGQEAKMVIVDNSMLYGDFKGTLECRFSSLAEHGR